MPMPPSRRRIYSQVGLSFALIATTVLAANYFIQFSVIPVSLLNNEKEGLPLLIQYNSHGVFLALEELGYLLMSMSFLFMAPVFSSKGRLEAAVRWIFVVDCVLAVVSLAAISILFGLDRQDRFEIVVISLNFMVLIANGVLLSRVFRQQLSK